MKHDLKMKFLQRLHIKEAWVIFFIMGIIMMNYPFIHIFHKPGLLLFGMPVLFLYLYVGWLVSILIIYLFVKAISLAAKTGDREHR